ncbi:MULTISPECIES: neutral zinc metallopeptidase [Streptosporangium]|uniref:Metalloprotease n=1 Tax=Streptosporangium brasiliense TaxID=47480 RepID=A0ABT9QUS1_9ACTN|nr:neutral zinc metallopeptidase [Streptosporangium brasiliense]MDP9860743.1 putative metalloprotease [Streptosporangium brasiliense]
MNGPRDWPAGGPRRRGAIRRTLPAALAFAIILGGLAYLGGDLQALIGTAPGSPRSAAATHRLYEESGPVDGRCDTLPPDPDADVGRTLRALSRCLDRMWAATLAEADLDYARPGEVRLVDRPREAACGTDDHGWAGIYCPEGRVVNVLVEEGRAFPMMFTLAHEYAHHVQEISGIADRRGSEVFDEAWSRRLELQADCLAAAALRTVGPILLREQRRWLARGGEEADGRQAESRESHGSGASSAAWMLRGQKEGTVRACNTWSAPADQVS